jgi:hypothetical protein
MARGGTLLERTVMVTTEPTTQFSTEAVALIKDANRFDDGTAHGRGRRERLIKVALKRSTRDGTRARFVRRGWGEARSDR